MKDEINFPNSVEKKSNIENINEKIVSIKKIIKIFGVIAIIAFFSNVLMSYFSNSYEYYDASFFLFALIIPSIFLISTTFVINNLLDLNTLRSGRKYSGILRFFIFLILALIVSCIIFIVNRINDYAYFDYRRGCHPTGEELIADNNLTEITTSSRGKLYAKGDEVYRISSGEPCGAGLQKTVFNAKTLKKINEAYFQDKNKIYYNESLIENADVETFENIEDYNQIYTYLFAKDKNNVFWGSKTIEGVDAKTFVLLKNKNKNRIAKDKNTVYTFYFSKIFKKNNVDAETFNSILNNSGQPTQYYKDKNKVYTLVNSKSVISLEFINPDNAYVDENGKLYELVDNKKVYYEKVLNKNSDCTDSDNGKDAYKNGLAICKDRRTGDTIHTTGDTCAKKLDIPQNGVEYVHGFKECSGDKCYVREGYCGEYQGLQVDLYEYIKCENGCKDGICIK